MPVWKTKVDRLELTLENISHQIKYDGVSDGVINGVSDGVKKELMLVVQLLAGSEGINTDDIVDVLGKSKPTIERYLKIARELNIIIFKGAPKSGGYFLIDKFKTQIKGS